MTTRTNAFVDSPESQCIGKRRYSKKSAARLAIRRMRTGKNAEGKTLPRSHFHAYRCSHCGQFHIGRFAEKGSGVVWGTDGIKDERLRRKGRVRGDHIPQGD